jgi:phage shock protein B
MGVLEFVTSIVAMVLGAITIWILILRKGRRVERAQPQGHYDVSELSTMAESMQDRISVLESILDAEVPDWRQQNETEATQ